MFASSLEMGSDFPVSPPFTKQEIRPRFMGTGNWIRYMGVYIGNVDRRFMQRPRLLASWNRGLSNFSKFPCCIRESRTDNYSGRAGRPLQLLISLLKLQ